MPSLPGHASPIHLILLHVFATVLVAVAEPRADLGTLVQERLRVGLDNRGVLLLEVEKPRAEFPVEAWLPGLLVPSMSPAESKCPPGATLVERLEVAVAEHARALADLASDEQNPDLSDLDPGFGSGGLATIDALPPFRDIRFHYRALIDSSSGRGPGLVAWYSLETASGEVVVGRVVVPISGTDRLPLEDGRGYINVPRLVPTSSVLHFFREGRWIPLDNPWTAATVKTHRPHRMTDFCDASCASDPWPSSIAPR